MRLSLILRYAAPARRGANAVKGRRFDLGSRLSASLSSFCLRRSSRRGSAPETLAHMRVPVLITGRSESPRDVIHPSASDLPRSDRILPSDGQRKRGASRLPTGRLRRRRRDANDRGSRSPRTESGISGGVYEGSGERGQKASAGQRTPALVPDDFEHRVLGDRQDAGAVIAPLASGGIKVFGAARPPHAWSTIKPVIAVAVAGPGMPANSVGADN